MQTADQQVPSNEPTKSEIPLDVLDLIFKSLTPVDLAICCRINKAVYPIAFNALYRDLRPKRKNIMTLCLKLCNDTTLASRVRSLIIWDRTGVDMYLGTIQDTLPLLPRLRTLGLYLGLSTSGSWILPLSQPSPFQLSSFSCTYSYDEHLASFLSGQLNLKHLSVTLSGTPKLLRAVTPRLLPNLISIYAPLSLVAALAPGRPIRDVTTSCRTHDDPTPLSFLSESTSGNGVQRLMVNFDYLQSIGGEHLSQSCPSLLYLILDADQVVPDSEEMIEQLTEWIEEYLSYATKLDCLTIRFYPQLSQTPCHEIDFSSMITSIFAASKKLTHVIVTFLGYRAKYVCKQVPGRDWYIVNV